MFSKFLKDKWKNKVAKTQAKANVDELSLTSASDVAMLNKLVNENESLTIRKSALIKLGNFFSYFNASQENTNKKLRKFAEQKVKNILLGLDDIELGNEEKIAFLDENPKLSLIESWLNHETNEDLQITLYEKLDKPQLAQKLFSRQQGVGFQRYIIEQTNDVNLLNKLSSKTNHQAIKQQIKVKVQLLNEAAEKPKNIAKQAQLILSMLLALKDKKDYQQVVAKQIELTKQWQQLVKEFDCLVETQQTQFLSKWQTIEEQLAKVFATRKEQYHQQLAADKLAYQQQAQRQKFKDIITGFSQQLSTAVFEDRVFDISIFNSEAQELKQQIKASVLSYTDKDSLDKQVDEQLYRVNHIEEIARSVTQATYLISQISQIQLPVDLDGYSDKLAFYQAWCQKWKEVENNANNMLPESIYSAYQQVTQQWHNALSELESIADKAFYKVKQKLFDLKRLINAGKYNASFGVFKQADALYSKLSQEQQKRLARDYQWVSNKIAELNDWEHYISTPRKQALLEEIKQLAKQPLANSKEQADKVKACRQQWNLLGHADQTLENQLNNEFNQACEQAFEPCRAYYAQLENRRAENLVFRKKLIAQASSLAELLAKDNVDWKHIDSEINKVQQSWRQAGEIDKSVYHTLNNEFKAILKPIKSAISAHREANKAEKVNLLNEARLLVEQEDLEHAVTKIKQLQKRWKEVGYSGPKDENSLWHKFRDLCDQVFTQREQLTDKVKAQYANDLEAIITDQQAIMSLDRQSKSEVEDAIARLNNLKNQLAGFNPFPKLQNNSVQNDIKQLKHQLNVIDKQKNMSQWNLLFSLLHESLDSSIEVEELPEFKKLKQNWQKKLKNIPKKSQLNDELRSNKTVELELRAGQKPNESFQAVTMVVQVALMQEQMSSGQVKSFEECFFEWLLMDKLTQANKDELIRIEKAYRTAITNNMLI